MIKPTVKNRDGEILMNKTHEAAFLAVKRKGLIHGLYLEDGKLMRVSVDGPHDGMKGMICLAKVVDVVKNINAIFVRLPDKSKCFVSMNDVLPICNLSGRMEPAQGDTLLLQVTKDAAKGKEASGTTIIKLEGEMCVITPGDSKILFSRKLTTNQKDALKELEEYFRQILPPNMNIIIRTAAAKPDKAEDCMKEGLFLIKELSELFARAKSRTDYSVLKAPIKQYRELLQDVIEKENIRILTEDEELYKELTQFISDRKSEKVNCCHLYQDKMVSLSVLYGIESKLSEALAEKVWLKSGAFLYIEPTQGMTVIDVNSGKFDKKMSHDDTYYQVNLEAAEEIARQIVLRNLSGIIIVDFINMRNRENIDKLLYNLSLFFQKYSDSAMIVDITKLGLVEITRKKTGKTLYEQILM